MIESVGTTSGRGAPRSESTILMLAGGKHTAIHEGAGPYKLTFDLFLLHFIAGCDKISKLRV
jgi:hypothetical protein